MNRFHKIYRKLVIVVTLVNNKIGFQKTLPENFYEQQFVLRIENFSKDTKILQKKISNLHSFTLNNKILKLDI